MGASSGSEGHPEKLPEPLCFGSGSLEIARLCSRLLHSARVGKEQSVSARRIKETKLLTLCTLRTLPPNALKLSILLTKIEMRHQQGQPSWGKRNFQPQSCLKLGTASPGTSGSHLRKEQQADHSYTDTAHLPPGRDQGWSRGAEPGWACQETWHFHM